MAEQASYLHESYPRYGGMMQNHPLTAEDLEYDDTCRAIDYAQQQLCDMPSRFFSAGELIWLAGFVNRKVFFPNQERLNSLLAEVAGLLKTIEAREKSQ